VIVTTLPIVADVVDKLVIAGVCNTVNDAGLLACLLTVTRTFPVVAPPGTGTTMVVAFQLVGVPVVPLKVTVLVPGVEPKLTPVIVAEVPTIPDMGDRLAMNGACDTVNGIALLASPPTVTTMSLEVAPLGTGTTMSFALQYVGTPTVPLNVTVLLPGLEPKFAPAIVTEAVGTPIFGDKLTIDGATTGELKLTATLSKVAVASDEVLPLFTTSPTYTFCAILTV
jgi:hypothetical protein